MSANKPESLDPFGVPMEGVNLIEAGAGTGKTYTITSLYLRLVLEAQRSVDQILVVTYTKAATGELRDRIRSRLAEAREAFNEGQSQDPFYSELLTRIPDHQMALRRLTAALQSFDMATVFTIHSFCQRILSDNAFESGMSFDTEVLADEGEVLTEIVEDFWRKQLYQASPLFADYALAQRFWPHELYAMVRSHVGKPFLVIRGDAAVPDFREEERTFDDLYAHAQREWQTSRHAITDCLMQNTTLNANKYRKTSIPVWIHAMEYLFGLNAPEIALFDKFEKFTASHLSASVKKGQAPPTHRFFEICDELKAAQANLTTVFNKILDALRYRLITYANQELEIRKRRQQLQSYNDLLINLERALQEKQGRRLAETIHRQFSAALIDEFQDTDPVQYNIFRAVYAGTALPVFFVGDPKQAIYSFRGADIFAYLKGRRDADRRFTLNVNWRSVPALIQAVNAIFSHSRAPFLFPEIPFEKADPAAAKHVKFELDGKAATPFRIWLVRRDKNGKPVNKGAANEMSARATAAEIARLLNLGATEKAYIGDSPLAGGDIAVLVRSHYQGQIVRQALRAYGIASVQHVQDNVFDSREAVELERLLLAMLAPERERLIKAALTTSLFGVNGNTLYGLSQDEQAWETVLEEFQHWHALWRDHGFIRMLREVLMKKKVPRRLLALPEGERRLTNVLHLSELLQSAVVQEHLGMEALVKWLTEKRQHRAAENEVEQLRLESDEHLVKIVTVHRSKGLQYPIVFCPFLWDGKLHASREDVITYHDTAQHDLPTLAFRSDITDDAIAQAKREELAENLRLLYVALTRAQYRCYLVWGAIKEAGTSALAWVVHGATQNVSGDAIDAVASHVNELSDEIMMKELAGPVRRGAGAISVDWLPQDKGKPFRPAALKTPELEACTFKRVLNPGWQMHSFSALATGHASELPDYDAASITPLQEQSSSVQLDIFSFPRGARPGECLHAIFERLDFKDRDRRRLETLVHQVLAEYGFDTHWMPVITEMVMQVLATPLDEDVSLRLQDVSLERRLNELEFYYPVANWEVSTLQRLFLAHGFASDTGEGAAGEAMVLAPTRGYMKGFIDLVFWIEDRFYLVDYKSNWLGAAYSDYASIFNLYRGLASLSWSKTR